MSARNFGQSHAIDRSCVAFGSGAAVMLGLAIPALIYALTRIGGAMYIDSHEEYYNNGTRRGTAAMRAIAHLAGTRKVSKTPALLIKAFDELCKHNTRNPMTVHPELTGFAEACYDTKSMRALLLCLRREKADPIDCLKWNITSQQWRDALVDALEVMIEDYVQERSNER